MNGPARLQKEGQGVSSTVEIVEGSEESVSVWQMVVSREKKGGSVEGCELGSVVIDPVEEVLMIVAEGISTSGVEHH